MRIPSSLLASLPPGLYRGRDVREMRLSPVKRPLRDGERRLYSQAERGSARGKGGPMSSSRNVFNLHSATGTFGSLTNVRFAAPFSHLDDSIKVLCITFFSGALMH